ncbi:MAG: cupredoxin domain-containing protein [Alphaproteobacteria bacterium]
MPYAKSCGVFAALIVFSLSNAPVWAAGGHDGGHGHSGGAHGVAGAVSDVTRTVEITMYDNYYEPEEIEIKEGETVRFVVTNGGVAVHEFAIATADMHLGHQPEMAMMVEHGVIDFDRIDWDAAAAMQQSMGHGMHDEPNSILLEPGQTGEIIWQFPEHAELEFACNIPGHYGSGMVGDIRLSH